MTSDPQRMDVNDLATRCQEESSRFFRDEVTDDRFCYELFRRALKRRNEYAWEAIWTTYRNLVSGWLRATGGFDQTNMPIDELITLSFEKFWRALESKPFEAFPTLQALLQYLRLCCASTVTDRLRRQKQDRFLADIDAAYYLASGHKPERQVMEAEERDLFWQRIHSLLNDEQEALLVRAYFVLGFKPRQIHKRYPAEFESVQDVYRVKRNVMNRLRRAEDMFQY